MSAQDGAAASSDADAPGGPDASRAIIAAYVRDNDLEHEWPDLQSVVVVLPGEQKLRTTVSIAIGQHAVTFNAFVIRHPDENEAELHRWLLRRNRRMYEVAYAIDHLGDVYLVATIGHAGICADELDQIFGAILDGADSVFNQLLEIGFMTAIAREYRWRRDRGESMANLAAFSHLFAEFDAADEAGAGEPSDPAE